ncbi:MAG: BMP family ABC transporter substrate-binding protein [Acidimicrobiia bacterium]|nr:MAG: BMP family ABC transporter substrate-binding protein [Acidimicrobiia bacterium]
MRSLLKRRGALFSLLLVLALVAAACSSGDSTETTAAGGGEETTTTTTVAPKAGEGIKVGMAFDIGGRGDQSFNDSAAAGLEKAIADYGIETKELEADAGGENREENLRLLAEDGSDLLIAVGFAFAEGVTNVATDFPDASFAIVDDASIELPNVAGLVFAEHEGSALVGAAAALKSQTGTIGFIGGVSGFGLIEKFQAGYEFGAKQINPGIEVLVTYLSAAPDFAGFNDPAKANESALGMYDEGADVIYHAAGGSGGGLFEAAKSYSEANDRKVWAIGVDSDQYNTANPAVQEYILTSMLKRVDVAVYQTITNFIEGNRQSGVQVFDLKADGVGYSTSGGFVDDITDQLDALREKIITGELEVPTVPEG